MLCGLGIKLRYVVSKYGALVKIRKNSQKDPFEKPLF